MLEPDEVCVKDESVVWHVRGSAGGGGASDREVHVNLLFKDVGLSFYTSKGKGRKGAGRGKVCQTLCG